VRTFQGIFLKQSLKQANVVHVIPMAPKCFIVDMVMIVQINVR
jgi:hypothetical protein